MPSYPRIHCFGSAEWQQRKLPPVPILAEAIAHFDIIAASLLASPPTESGLGRTEPLVNLRRPQRSAVAPPLTYLGPSALFFARWRTGEFFVEWLERESELGVFPCTLTA